MRLCRKLVMALPCPPIFVAFCYEPVVGLWSEGQSIFVVVSCVLEDYMPYRRGSTLSTHHVGNSCDDLVFYAPPLLIAFRGKCVERSPYL